MKILVVSATPFENHFCRGLDVETGEILRLEEPFNHEIDLLITGVGAVPTAFGLTRFVDKYQLIINIGIAGSYTKEYPLGSVVWVNEDVFGDYGVDDNGRFRSLSELNLHVSGVNPLMGNLLVNPYLKNNLCKVQLPQVRGVTLSAASGSTDIINKIVERWNPDIETMESAAVFYVCKMMNKDFICLRSISNFVEPRDRSKWRVDLAVENLNKELRNLIGSLQ